jgi:hypothetical protein
MIKARASPSCELCKRERGQGRAAVQALPEEMVVHIQSAQCKAQKKSVIGAHNKCWKYLVGAITNFGKAERKFEFIGDDKDRQLESLWKDTEIGNVLPWEDIEDEAERMLELRRDSQDATTKDNENGEQKCDQEVMRDGADSYEEVIFGRRRPDSVVVDWANKVPFVLEFKRTSDQRRDYRERGESRAKAQHDILIQSLEKVARDADDENEGWKIKLLIFVGGTSGSVNVKTFNDKLQELQVIESKWNAIRKGPAFELLNAQDAVLCSYFAQRAEARGERQVQVGNRMETFQGLGNFK